MLDKEFFHKYKHFLAIIAYAIVGFLFSLCEKYISPQYEMYSSIDSYIPFVKEMVIPYITWYLYIAFAIIYLGIKSKEDFYKLITFLVSGMLIAMFIYVVFPNCQNLRATTLLGSDLFSKLIHYLYYIDTPTNVNPSLHVIISIGIYCSLANSEPLKNNRFFNSISFILMVAISISTVFIKQHSIIDVFFGALIGIIIYFIIYRTTITETIINFVNQKHEKENKVNS
ncbi:phosphatase PAP2 family protein [Clostridium cellulovorans]|uniref:Phosphoesterase PA-phosphatase related n=1 Tax=Clostridium cellulovorans (strain ATCC 35296 / DSM 3052 / OCM 3 / 743B) TaxID=573061 RepID=D9SMW2_CLOC7|nr:phosphatase PAP2 family protein [Clostridium cellulovorans]ADL51828.1 phosphoesterase PA-phosphatase related [Clostridium cellulovorans 743B]